MLIYLDKRTGICSVEWLNLLTLMLQWINHAILHWFCHNSSQALTSTTWLMHKWKIFCTLASWLCCHQEGLFSWQGMREKDSRRVWFWILKCHWYAHLSDQHWVLPSLCYLQAEKVQCITWKSTLQSFEAHDHAFGLQPLEVGCDFLLRCKKITFVPIGKGKHQD